MIGFGLRLLFNFSLEISDMKYKEIFAAIDKDGNGGISRQELAEYMVQLAWTGVGHGMDVSGQVWDSIAGEDGEIQMEELNQLFDFILLHNPMQMSNTTQPEWGSQHMTRFWNKKDQCLHDKLQIKIKFTSKFWPGLIKEYE